jgi:outer membrane protein assembly factor BamB
MMRRFLAVIAGCCVLLLGACDKDKEVDPPAKLVEFKPSIRIDKDWAASVGGGMESLRLGLRPAVEGGKVYAAAHDGDVYAFDLKNGRVRWRTQTKLPLSGGPGLGAGRLFVGSSEGDLVAINAEDGKELWRVQARGEVLAAPAANESVVVVRTVDGRLLALDPSDGHELWLTEEQVPRLTLRGTSSPVISGDMVLCGFDNGRVVAVGLADGDVLWETTIAPSRGRTELERLVDIDSAVQVAGTDVFVVGFQGRAAMLALESGQAWWSRDASSHRGLVVGEDTVYVSTSDGDVTALRRRDGTPQWTQSALHRRGLTAPAIDGPTIVVADFEGYLHWLDAASGDFLARAETDGHRITNAPLAVDGAVIVMTDSGKLNVFRRLQNPAPSSG